jgi:hypothetical protein
VVRRIRCLMKKTPKKDALRFPASDATLGKYRSYTVKIESNRTKLRLIGQINGWVFGARAYFTCLRTKCL